MFCTCLILCAFVNKLKLVELTLTDSSCLTVQLRSQHRRGQGVEGTAGRGGGDSGAPQRERIPSIVAPFVGLTFCCYTKFTFGWDSAQTPLRELTALRRPSS